MHLSERNNEQKSHKETLTPLRIVFVFFSADRNIFEMTERISHFGQNAWKQRLMNTAMASLNTNARLMTEMFQWPKCRSKKNRLRYWNLCWRTHRSEQQIKRIFNIQLLCFLRCCHDRQTRRHIKRHILTNPHTQHRGLAIWSDTMYSSDVRLHSNFPSLQGMKHAVSGLILSFAEKMGRAWSGVKIKTASERKS